MANEVAVTPQTTRRRKKGVSKSGNKGLRIDIFNAKDPKLESLGKFLQELNKIDGKSGILSGKIVVGSKKKA